MQSLLSGATASEIVERIKNTVPVSWINSCKIWPAVTAFMFTFIPLEYRNIFGGVIAIGWQTYLSLLNQRAVAQEELELAPAVEAPRAVAKKIEIERERGGQKCTA
jgi:protein Mpv17